MRDNGSKEMSFISRAIAKVVKVFLFLIIAGSIGGWVVMALWNWLMPVLFGLHAITFLQAVGLLLLSKILLGGFHKHGGGRRDWNRGWGGRWEKRWGERWEQMSPEEREKFRAGMRSKRGCWGGRDYNGPREETTEQNAQ